MAEELDAHVEANLAQLDQLPPPLPALAAFLRTLATGHLPGVPTALPPELQEFLTQLLIAIREAQRVA